MIRINLLPRKRGKTESAGGSPVWLIVLLAITLIELLAFGVLYALLGRDFDAVSGRNRQLKAQIEQLERNVKSHGEVKEKLAQFEQREAAIGRLQAGRVGPAALLLELSRLTTMGRGPTVAPDMLEKLQKDKGGEVYNLNWDARQLQITKLVQQGESLQLTGVARQPDDISELARRMAVSQYIREVTLLPAKRKSGGDGDMMSFDIRAKVVY